MKSNICLRLMSFLLLLILILCLTSCSNGGNDDNNDINRIEDINKLDEVISLNEVDYTGIDYENYIDLPEYSWFDEELDDKSTFKLMYKSDDYEVSGYICAPKDYFKKEYPILIYLRGGYGGYELLPVEVGQLTNFGFIVMSTQYRGNDGGTGTDGYGGDDVQDGLSMIDIAEQLQFSNGKIYLFGESRGGLQAYSTLKEEYLADRDRISAAVVMSGVSDLEKFYNFRDWNMKGVLINFIGDPKQVPDEYKKRSVVYWPEMINVPLLLIHGRTDVRVLHW